MRCCSSPAPGQPKPEGQSKLAGQVDESIQGLIGAIAPFIHGVAQLKLPPNGQKKTAEVQAEQKDLYADRKEDMLIIRNNELSLAANFNRLALPKTPTTAKQVRALDVKKESETA